MGLQARTKTVSEPAYLTGRDLRKRRADGEHSGGRLSERMRIRNRNRSEHSEHNDHRRTGSNHNRRRNGNVSSAEMQRRTGDSV